MREAPIHAPEDIAQWFMVARGKRIAHHFIAQFDYSVVVFQDPSTETFDDTDIVRTQELLANQLDEAYVYDGVVHPEVALQKAIEMRAENRRALRRE